MISQGDVTENAVPQAEAMDSDPTQRIYDAVTDAIHNRRQYEERLRVMWEVRHNGVVRKREKNWQSDTPLKIGDPAIDTIKPQLVQGIFTADTLATFASMDPEISSEYAKLAAQFFSDHLKRRSNFFKQFVIVVDMELQDGKALFKTIWDPVKMRLEFHAIQSIYFIVPDGTEDLESAEWACQVHRMSKTAYKRLAKTKGWPTDDESVNALCGRDGSSILPQWIDEKKRKEGLHYGTTKDEVVLWEYYERDEDGAWQITFLCPNKPDGVLGDTQPLPYQHGELPFIDFGAELKDKDYHSPRGVVEKILPEERIATQYRNYISDHAAFSSRPMFTTSGVPVGNTNNLTAEPGKVFTGINLTSVQMAEPPGILAEEMQNARQQGERMGGAGDYALSQNTQNGKPRTATEVGVVAQISSVAMDLRSRLNRDSLTRVFHQAWRLLVQYKPTDLKFFCMGSMEVLPDQALVDSYLIEPSGNPDGYSRQYEVQKAQMIGQLCKGDPAFDQDELKKYLLETADPSLVKRLFIGTKVAQTREAEDQAFDVLLLREGFATTINPGEDQAARAIITAQYLQRVVLEKEPTPQRGMQALQQHIMLRVQALKEENPQAAAQLVIQLKQIQAQTIAMVKQQEQQQVQQQALSGGLPPSANGAAAQPGAPTNGAAPGGMTMPGRQVTPPGMGGAQ